MPASARRQSDGSTAPCTTTKPASCSCAVALSASSGVMSDYPWFEQRWPHPAGDRGCGDNDLEILIIRTRATFGRHPGDDLVRVLDVAGLAVHAVGGIDLQALAGAVVDDLVDAGGAEAGARVAVFGGAPVDADAGVGHVQVDRLVLVVFGGGEVDAGEAVARR